MTVAKPDVKYSPSRNIFEWAEYNLTVVADRIAEDGKVELYFYGKNGTAKTLLHMGQANLLSSTMQRDFIKSLTTRNAEIDWQTILTYISNLTMQHLREGEPVVWLNEDYGKTKPEYLLYPLFVKDAPNIIYADRSSAKSLFITMISIGLTIGWYNNNLNLEISDEPRTVLYCDWESSAQILGWQKECLRKGMFGEDTVCDIPYLHCSGSISDNVHNIQTKIEQTKAKIIVIDSLGMAVGDDLNLTKPAFAFYSALRQLPVTPLIIGHTSKDKESRRKTVYGNAYYENEARSVWEVVKQQEPMADELTITLFQRKSPPFAHLHEPLAYKFNFNNDITTIELAEPIKDKSNYNEDDLHDTDIVLETLSESTNPLTIQQIANLTELPNNNIRQACFRLKNSKQPKIKQVGDKYVFLR